MPSATNMPEISADLRITAREDTPLSPAQALAFAEQVTTAAMFRQAELLPPARRRRLRSDNLNLASLRRIAL